MLHSQTLLILAASFFVVLPVLMWWATAGQRSSAVAWWCAGSLLVGLGIVLMGARPWIMHWLSYHTANTFLMVGMLLWVQSLRVMDSRGWPLAWLGIALLLMAFFYTALYSFASSHVRGMSVRWVLGGVALYTAWQAWRLGQRLHSHNAIAISVCYLLLGMGLWMQLLQISVHKDPNPFSTYWDASVIALLALATSAVGHFCFTGMVIDTSTQAQLQAVRARTAAQESARLATQLRLLDRQDRMRWVSASMTHELNEPLATALMQAQSAQYALRSGQADKTVMAQTLEQVTLAMRQASGILDRIRSSARAHGVMRLERLDLREVLQATMDLMKTEWDQRGIQVDLALPEEPLWCDGDEVALSQVLVNLLRNATQAMQAGPERQLHVQAQVSPHEVMVIVRDHGPGLPAAVLAALSEPGTSTREQLLGMGLALSRAIALQHHGRLALRNHPGGGAEATLFLPHATRKWA
jgi:signal transduction histidine kinase